jgi:uncharacterized protein YjbI with pentapeptide repeats
LRGANFTGANLIAADFSGANLAGADFTRANLDRAKLSDARGLEWAKGLHSTSP